MTLKNQSKTTNTNNTNGITANTVTATTPNAVTASASAANATAANTTAASVSSSTATATGTATTTITSFPITSYSEATYPLTQEEWIWSFLDPILESISYQLSAPGVAKSDELYEKAKTAILAIKSPNTIDKKTDVEKAVAELESCWNRYDYNENGVPFDVVYTLVECYTHGYGVKVDFAKAAKLNKLIEIALLGSRPGTLQFMVSCKKNPRKFYDTEPTSYIEPKLYNLSKCSGIGYLLMCKAIEMIKTIQALKDNKPALNINIYEREIVKLKSLLEKFTAISPYFVILDLFSLLKTIHIEIHREVREVRLEPAAHALEIDLEAKIKDFYNFILKQTLDALLQEPSTTIDNIILQFNLAAINVDFLTDLRQKFKFCQDTFGPANIMRYLSNCLLDEFLVVNHNVLNIIKIIKRMEQHHRTLPEETSVSTLELLSECYQKGLGVPKDPTKALEYKTKKDSIIKTEADKMLRSGLQERLAPIAVALRAEGRTKGTNASNLLIKTQIAINTIVSQDIATTLAVSQLIEAWKKEGDERIYDPLYVLAECYTHGWGVSQDFDIAAKYYKTIEKDLLLNFHSLIISIFHAKDPNINNKTEDLISFLGPLHFDTLFSNVEKFGNLGYLILVKAFELVRTLQRLEFVGNLDERVELYIHHVNKLEVLLDKFANDAPKEILYNIYGFLKALRNTIFLDVNSNNDTVKAEVAILNRKIHQLKSDLPSVSDGKTIEAPNKLKLTNIELKCLEEFEKSIQEELSLTAHKAITGGKRLVLQKIKYLFHLIRTDSREKVLSYIQLVVSNCFQHPECGSKIVLKFLVDCFRKGLFGVNKDLTIADALFHKYKQIESNEGLNQSSLDLIAARMDSQEEGVSTNEWSYTNKWEDIINTLKQQDKLTLASNGKSKAITKADSPPSPPTPITPASPTKEELAQAALAKLLKEISDISISDPNASYTLNFTHWRPFIKRMPENYRLWNSITLKGDALKNLKTNIDTIRHKGRLPNDLIEFLCLHSEEQRLLNEKEADETLNQTLNEINKKCLNLPKVILNAMQSLGKAQRDVHMLNRKVLRFVDKNDKLLAAGDYIDKKRTARQKEKDRRDWKSIKTDVEAKKYDVAFDRLLLELKEAQIAFEKTYAEKSVQMAAAYKAKDLKGMQAHEKELYGAFEAIQRQIATLENFVTELETYKNKLYDQKNLFKNSSTKNAERSKKEKTEFSDYHHKQVLAYKMFEYSHQQKLVALAKKETEDKRKQKEAAQEKREAERNAWKEAARARHEEFLKNQVKGPTNASTSACTASSTNPTTSASPFTSISSPNPMLFSANSTCATYATHFPKPSALTLNTAGAITAKLNDKAIQTDIENQLAEGRLLIRTIMDEHFDQYKLFALLGKLGQILEAMHNPKTLTGNPILEKIATAIRNTIYHGDSNIIPNFDKKLSSEQKKLCDDLIARLQDALLNILSKDWQNTKGKTSVEQLSLPPILADMAVFYTDKNPALGDHTQAITIEALNKELNDLYPDSKGGAIHTHSKVDCEQQLAFYCRTLEDLTKPAPVTASAAADRGPQINSELVKKHVIGYLESRISTYAVALKGIDSEAYKAWASTHDPIVIKLGIEYRHNKVAAK